MFPSKRDPASPRLQLKAFLVPLIYTTYQHFSSRPHCSVWVGNSKAQHFAPVFPEGPAARPLSITKSTSTNLQGIWKAKHSPHIPVQAIHPGSGLRRRDVVPPLQLSCWQGQACLTQTPRTTAATQACDWFCLPEAKGEDSLSFSGEILLYFLGKCTSAPLFMCTNLTAYNIWLKKQQDPVGSRYRTEKSMVNKLLQAVPIRKFWTLCTNPSKAIVPL